mmetsp:Transcript_23464/g.32109  ORF Transcript_23464/g.32109 Transcript_23464/m.32109 type:complete len:801 (+) Transcript_23464:48-2450(+)
MGVVLSVSIGLLLISDEFTHVYTLVLKDADTDDHLRSSLRKKNINLLDHGGPTGIGNIRIFQLYQGFDKPNEKIDKFASKISGSTWITGISNLVGGEKIIFRSNSSLVVSEIKSMTFSDLDVQTTINRKIENGVLPKDDNGYYMFMFRGDWIVTKPDNFGGGKPLYWLDDWCGYHSSFSIGNTTIKYAVIGDPTASTNPAAKACMSFPSRNSANPVVDNMATIYARTLVGMLTNPFFDGWYADDKPSSLSREVGDVCSGTSDGALGRDPFLFRLPNLWLPGSGCPSGSIYVVNPTVAPSPMPTVSPSLYQLPPLSLTSFPTPVNLFSCTNINDCGNNKNVIIDSSVSAIAASAFDFSKVTMVVIPSTVTSIGVGAFSNCGSLKSVTIPTTVTSLPDLTFFATALTTAVIPTSVVSIGTKAFSLCAQLATVVIPTTVKTIGTFAFSDCTILNCVYRDESSLVFVDVTIFRNSPLNGCPTQAPTAVPSATPSYLFTFCTSGKTCGDNSIVTFPPEATAVADNAFLASANTAVVVIPSTITAIGTAAFSQCPLLVTVVIPTTVSSLPSALFLNSTSLQSAVIPTSVTSLGTNAFSNCRSLVSVTIPTSVTLLSTSVFESCGINVIVIPTSVLSIESTAFMDCRSLVNVTIPTSVTSISIKAFLHNAIVSLTIPTSVTTIGNFAFARTLLSSLSLPTSITEISADSFEVTYKLRSIVIPTSVKVISTFSFGRSGLRSVVIPSSVTYIGDNVFVECADLVSVEIATSGLATVRLQLIPLLGQFLSRLRYSSCRTFFSPPLRCSPS